MADEFEYEHTGPSAADFPFHPVQATLEPGQRVTTSSPVTHAELRPVNAAAKKAAEAPKDEEKPKAKRVRKPKAKPAAAVKEASQTDVEEPVDPAAKE